MAKPKDDVVSDLRSLPDTARAELLSFLRISARTPKQDDKATEDLQASLLIKSALSGARPH